MKVAVITTRMHGYGMSLSGNRHIKRYSTIPIHDVYITEGTVDGEVLTLLPILFLFDIVNPYSVVIVDNASIHHVHEVQEESSWC